MLSILKLVLSIFLMVICLTPITVEAQDNYFFTHLKSDAGLPHQQVSSLAFDHDGMLWVGTRNGLAKYDGYSFVAYYNDINDVSSIPHNFIRHIFVDSDNNVWIGSDVGICRYRRESDDFERYNVGGDHITRIAETADGSVICTGSKVYKLLKGTNEFKHMPRQSEDYIVGLAVSPDDKIYLATNKSIAYYTSEMLMETVMDTSLYSDFLTGFDAIVPLFFDSNGLLWIGRDGKGVMCLNLSSGERIIYDEGHISNGTVRVITEDSNGLIWLGTEKGITTINTKSGNISIITQQFGNSRTLSDNAIYSIVSDTDDNMWVGTYFGGINLVLRNATQFAWTAPGYGFNTLSGKAVRRIIEPIKGNLWLATEDGGINILNINNKHIEHFDHIPNLGTNIHELFCDQQNGEMWIGTFRNGLFRYNLKDRSHKHYTAFNSGLKSNAIFAIAQQGNDNRVLYIATTKGLLVYDFNEEQFIPVNHPILDTDFIYCLYTDHLDNLWAGTVNHGLFRIDKKTKEIKGWGKSSALKNNCLNDNYITTIFEDNEGRIFVGTNNAGLYYIDSETLEFTRFKNETQTLGTICSIIQDNTKNIWLTTSGGLFKVDPNDLTAVKFTATDGLPENQFNFSSTLLASDNNLYCGTVNGLVSFNPNVKKRSDSTTAVHLWRLILNNNPVSPKSSESPLSSTLDAMEVLELDYGSSRVFSIDYGVVDPIGAQNVKYQIFIEGLDKEWRDVGTQRRFTAMEIPYGSYVFKVRASSSGENWDNAAIKQLQLKIAPPYYHSSVAWLIYVFIGLAIVYFAYKLFNWRVKEKQQKKLKLIERAKKDELNREKMEFFTNISHELKTPLSLILAPLKQLSSNESLSDESRERLSAAIANTSKMVDLINELVTFNRVESGNFQLFLQKGNPLTLIETMTGYFRGPASDKNICINVMTQNNGEDVWFSPTYLERIISNLLSNAIKYTGENGNIDVRASIVEGNDNSVYLQLEVKDTGIGIVPEELDNIFKKYYQTRRGYNASHTGWGIGLATVKKLVEIHKGNISVTSKVGEGTSFVVRLNVTPSAFDKSSCISTTDAQPLAYQPTFISNTLAVYSHEIDTNKSVKDDKKVSILLVEDNPQLLRFLSDEFAKDYNVYTATNGIEALKVTEEYPIDIVVSDVMMPEMDGIELCDRLKNNLATSHIPVILLTAKSDEESTMAGFKSGAEAYVAKPFDPQLLALRVKNILRARRAYIDSKIEDSSVDEPIEELPPLNKFDNEFITRINQLIDDNMDNSEFSIADITRELAISRSLLHIKMKTFFNSSMTDYIKQRRMDKACELLKKGYNVSETAYRAGFSDPNYFSKVFRKTFGMSPSDFISASPSE